MSTPRDPYDDDDDADEFGAAQEANRENRREAILKARSRPPIATMDTGYKMVGPVIMGLVIGYFIDQHFMTRPWWMLGLTFFGLLTGFWSILRPLYFSKSANSASPSPSEKE